MPFGGNFLSDPANLAVVMAGLALVVALVAVLHYSLERKVMLDRLRRLEAALASAMEESQSGQKTAHEVTAAAADDDNAGEVTAVPADEFSPDSLPPGIRFV